MSPLQIIKKQMPFSGSMERLKTLFVFLSVCVRLVLNQYLLIALYAVIIDFLAYVMLFLVDANRWHHCNNMVAIFNIVGLKK